MTRSRGGAPLDELRRLDATWGELRTLVFKCWRAKRVTEDDEDHYSEVVRDAQVLYGGVSNLLGAVVMVRLERQFDAFQFVLAQPRLSDILGGALPTFELWDELWSLGASAIRQAIGRLEAKGTGVRYMPAGSQLDAYVQLKDTMEEAVGSLVLVDPYVDDSTLQALLGVNPTVNIRVLTVKPSKDFAHALERFREQWKGTVEARVGPKDLHDRFVLLDERVFLSGASLKDLGQRASVLLELHNEAAKAAITRDVDESWKTAQAI